MQKKYSQLAKFSSPILIASLSAPLAAQSLDDAVINQLAVSIGGLGCAALFDNGGSPVGALAEICGRAVPAGAESGASGGGSATTATQESARTLKQTVESSDSASIAAGWSLFFSADSEAFDRDETDLEGAYESTITRFVAGTSVQVSESATVSVLVNKKKQDGDYLSSGDFTQGALSFGLIANWQINEKFGIDLAATTESVDVDRSRLASFEDIFNGESIYSVSGQPLANYEYDQTYFNGRLNYELVSGRFSLLSSLGIDWQNADFGTHSEQGDSGLELTFHDDSRELLQSVLGFQASYSFATGFGAFIPQANLNWYNNLDSDGRTVNVSFVYDENAAQFSYQTDEEDSSFFRLGVGGVFVFAHGVQAFINYETLLAHSYFDSSLLSAGLRVEL